MELILPAPSLTRGYATSAARSAYPELWQGLGAAWLPCLGETGLVLPDYSGGGNPLTLQTVSDWVVGRDGPQLYFSGTGHYATSLNPGAGGRPWNLSGTGLTVVLALDQLPTSSFSNVICFGHDSSTYSGFTIQSTSSSHVSMFLSTGAAFFDTACTTPRATTRGLFIGRYDGTNSIGDWYAPGAVASSGYSTLAHAGPLYWGSTVNHHLAYDSVAYVCAIPGVLVYNRDIGAGLAHWYGETYLRSGAIATALPFYKRKRVYKSSVVPPATIFTSSASDALTLSDNDNIQSIVSRGFTDAMPLTDSFTSVGPRLCGTQDTLMLSDGIHTCQALDGTLSDSLAFADTFRSSQHYVSTSDTVSFADYSDTKVHGRSISDQLVLTETFDRPIWPGSSDALTLGESFAIGYNTLRVVEQLSLAEVFNYRAKLVIFGDTLSFAEDNHSSGRSAAIYDTLPLIETVIGSSGTYPVDGDVCALQDTYGVVTTLSRSTSEQLRFAETFQASCIKSTAHSVGVSDTLQLSESLLRTLLGSVSDPITLVESFVGVGSSAITDTVLLSESYVTATRRSQGAGDILAVTESYLCVSEATGVQFQYQPFGSLPALSAPKDGITAPFQLVFPATGTVTDSVTLRAPELGNKDRLSFNRVLRETRGGTLIVFADPTWPNIQTLVLNFVGLTSGEGQALLAFFENYLGQEIGIIDWEQRYWKGIITKPEAVIADSPNRYSASFEFEGELEPTWSPQIIPVLPNTPLRRTIEPSNRSGNRSGVPSPLEPMTNPAPTPDTYYAVADIDLIAGQAIYLESNTHAVLASSDSDDTFNVIGFVTVGATAGNTVTYITEGSATLAGLTPGSTYYLGTAGQITSTAPVIGYVVQVGHATSATSLDIEIEQAIKL